MRNARLLCAMIKNHPSGENRVSSGYYRSGGARYAHSVGTRRQRRVTQLAGRAAIAMKCVAKFVYVDNLTSGGLLRCIPPSG